MPRQKKQHLKRRKDGRFCCRYHGIQFMAWTEEEALRLRDEFKQQEAAGLRREDMPLLEYADRWLHTRKAGVKATTYNGYVSVLNTVLEPVKAVPVSDITSDDIATVYASLAGKSASFISKARQLITGILDAAVDAGFLPRNPARLQSVTAPKGSAGSHRAITQEERRLILETPHRMQVAALIMLYCGLRRGEVLALTADDITDRVHVSKAVSYVSNQPIISTTKTAAGIRDVPVLSVLRPFLCDLTGFILPGKDGKPMTEQAFTRGWEAYLNALSRAAGHRVDIRPHDLRVSFCTAARDAGVDLKQAIIWMGHADEKMILRVYDQPGEKREKDQIKAFERAIRMQNGMQRRRYRLKTGDIPDVSRET